jgi:hypothetical protein
MKVHKLVPCVILSMFIQSIEETLISYIFFSRENIRNPMYRSMFWLLKPRSIPRNDGQDGTTWL